MSSVLENFLNLLMDGDWHEVAEVAKLVRLTDEQTVMIARFFSQYNFLSFVEEKRMKIDTTLKELLVATTPENPQVLVK